VQINGLIKDTDIAEAFAVHFNQVYMDSRASQQDNSSTDVYSMHSYEASTGSDGLYFID
jgi:hypothetical protein